VDFGPIRESKIREKSYIDPSAKVYAREIFRICILPESIEIKNRNSPIIPLNTKNNYYFCSSAKVYAREKFSFGRSAKVCAREMQKFRGFLKPRKLMPAKVNVLK